MLVLNFLLERIMESLNFHLTSFENLHVLHTSVLDLDFVCMHARVCACVLFGGGEGGGLSEFSIAIRSCDLDNFFF